jgi:NADH-quinone oxidoreductase subunit A
VFLYPWAVAFGSFGWFILIEMIIFVAILVVGLAYAWKEGALRWR